MSLSIRTFSSDTYIKAKSAKNNGKKGTKGSPATDLDDALVAGEVAGQLDVHGDGPPQILRHPQLRLPALPSLMQRYSTLTFLLLLLLLTCEEDSPLSTALLEILLDESS